MSKISAQQTLALLAGLGMGDLIDNLLPRRKKRKVKEINHLAMEAAEIKRKRRAERNKRLAGNDNTNHQV